MTNPSPQPDDFEVAQVVAEKLRTLPGDRQERVLRWVAESLGVAMAAPREPAKAPIERAFVETSPSNPPTARNIRSFVEAKKPASDIQFATVAAYFYRFEAPETERRETLDAKALQGAARLADRKRLASPKDTLNNAKKQGFLDNKGRGEFSINSVGENLVAMILPAGGKVETKKGKKKGKKDGKKNGKKNGKKQARARRR